MRNTGRSLRHNIKKYLGKMKCKIVNLVELAQDAMMNTGWSVNLWIFLNARIREILIFLPEKCCAMLRYNGIG